MRKAKPMKDKCQSKLFNNLSVSEFLEEYWNQKPLLIKGFHKTPSTLASKQNLMDMALDENFESRIIFPPNKSENWVAKEGPVTKTDLDKNEWTLAIHGLDLYFREFYEIKEKFDFIPNWQFDDIMATYSQIGQGVGAHIDNYDVFIFQGEGLRKWQLDTNPNPEYIEGIDIKILKEFNPDIEWVLEPGDMIYIPPCVAHHGITIKESISYSIGFKAQDSEKVLNSFAMEFLSEYVSSDFIKQSPRLDNESPYMINTGHIENIKKHIMEKFFEDKTFTKWVQSYLSSPRSPIPEGENIDDNQNIFSRLDNGEELYFDPNMRFNFTHKDDKIQLCISTLHFQVSEGDYKLLGPILKTPSFNLVDLSSIATNHKCMSIIRECIKFGILYFS